MRNCFPFTISIKGKGPALPLMSDRGILMGWNKILKQIYDIVNYPIVPPPGKTREEVIRENDLKWYKRTGNVESICEHEKYEHEKEDAGISQDREDDRLCRSMVKQISFETGCRMECRAAFEVGRAGERTGKCEDPWAKKIRLGKLMIHDFYSLKGTEGRLVKKLHAGGSDICLVGAGRHQKYGDVLHLHAQIPTFDCYDRQSDSYHDVYFLTDGKDIHFLYVKGGYSIAWVGAGIEVYRADSQLLELFRKANFPVEAVEKMQ